MRNRPAACGARSKVRLIEAEDDNRAHYKARPRTTLHMIGIVGIQAEVAHAIVQENSGIGDHYAGRIHQGLRDGDNVVVLVDDGVMVGVFTKC